LVGRSIGSHPEIESRIENPSTFGLITKIATTQDLGESLALRLSRWMLRRKLSRVLQRSRCQYVLEKSHPSIWLAELLLSWFPDSKFVAVWRDVEPTVASMLRHAGVRRWYSVLPLDRTNRFLGIDETNVDRFSKMTIEEQCALRWRSHQIEIRRLLAKYPGSFLSIRYDDFVKEQHPILAQVQDFLGVGVGMEVEPIKDQSLDRWKHDLDSRQLARIYSVVSDLSAVYHR
jgi:hypothetical protein